MFWAGWGYPESGFRWRFLSKFMLSLLRMTGLKGLLTGGFRCPRRGGGELTHFDFDPRVRGELGVRETGDRRHVGRGGENGEGKAGG